MTFFYLVKQFCFVFLKSYFLSHYNDLVSHYNDSVSHFNDLENITLKNKFSFFFGFARVIFSKSFKPLLILNNEILNRYNEILSRNNEIENVTLDLLVTLENITL